jgi:membrane protease YdiL (CAAX protease family)
MATSQDMLFPSRDRTLVAPLWHTILLVVVILGITFLQARQQPNMETVQIRSRLPVYGAMIVFELSLFAYVWLFGLRLTGTPLRALIGGKWSSAADVVNDVGAALLFWVVAAGALVALGKILGVNADSLRAVKALLPQGPLETALWVALCVTAGFCEELVFRGYLQRQFFAITGRMDIAIVFQAIVFGVAHMYQGWKGALTITVYGALFGILAMIRKSLRPGMIQHAGQDMLSGIIGGMLSRRHLF